MPIEILMPALSPTMTEGNLAKWNKKEGDTVKSGDVIAEIETDKATMEVEAVDEGIMGKILIPGGTQGVKVNQLIALLLEEGEDASALEGMTASAAPVAAASKPEEIKAVAATPSVAQAGTQTTMAQTGADRVFATPLARRIAGQNDVNLHVISGSGPRGRIVKADVEGAMASGGAKPANRQLPASPQLSGFEPAYDVMETSTMRKVIAARLTESKQTVPHFYLTVECAIDALLAARKRLNAHGGDDYKLSVNDFVIKAVASALKRVPEANASWINDQIIQYKSVDVSVAVAIDGGLITPVIRESDTKSLATLSTEMKDLASRARQGKLVPQEFQGGTFTISNLGMYGIKEFAAIINPPQACILAVGAGEERPVVKNGALTIATMMSCTLSVDHRVVDGAVAAKFLSTFKEIIEDPYLMLV